LPLGELLRFLALAGLVLAAGVGMTSGRWRLEDAPLAALTGLACVLVLGNIFSHLLPPPVSFGLALAVPLMLGWGLRRPQAQPAPARAGGLWTLAAALGCALLLAVNALVWSGTYHLDHLLEVFPNVATIANGNIPFQNPFYPRVAGFYHYGPAFLLAVLHSLAGIPLEHLLGLVPVLAGVPCILLGTRLVHDATRSREAAAVAFCGLAFAGPMTWLLHLGPGAAPSVLQTILDRGQPLLGQHPLALGAQTYPFGFMLNNLIMVFTVGFALAAAAHLCGGPGPGWRGDLGAVACLGALALSSESFFACLLAAAALWALRLPPRRARLGAILAAAAALAALQGGVITDLLFRSSGLSSELYRFSWRWPPGLPAWGAAAPSLARPGQLLRMIGLDYGATFWLIPLAALGARRAGSGVAGLLFLAAAAGIAVSAAVSYPLADWDMTRFLMAGAFILPIPYACGWAALAGRRFLRGAVIALLTLSCGGFWLRLAAQGRFPPEPPPPLMEETDRRACDWMRRNLPARSVFISDVPLLLGMGGLLSVAAVRRHGQAVPFDHARALERLDADELRREGAGYVFLTERAALPLSARLRASRRFEFVRDFDGRRFLLRLSDRPGAGA
jgi:hypothetical protein